MKDQIVYSVTFHCAKCKSNDLQSPGAVRTLAERLYLVFTCGECGSSVPIEIDKIIAELYKKPLGSDSGSVN